MDSKTPKPKIKSLSFKYKNFDCYEYIKDMSNFSDYICDLIRLDMEHGLIRKIYNLPQSQVESNYKLVAESTPSKVKPEENKNKVENNTKTNIAQQSEILWEEEVDELIAEAEQIQFTEEELDYLENFIDEDFNEYVFNHFENIE